MQNKPTDKMALAARDFLLGLEMGQSDFDSMRKFCDSVGNCLDLWPDWAKTAKGHMSKHSKAIIIYSIMAASEKTNDK